MCNHWKWVDLGIWSCFRWYCSTRAWPLAVQCYKFICVYFLSIENKLFSNLFMLPLWKVWFGHVLSQIWREQKHPTAICKQWHWCCQTHLGILALVLRRGCVCVCVQYWGAHTPADMCVGFWEMSRNNFLQSTGTSEMEEVMCWKCLPCIWLFLCGRWAPRVFHLPTSFLWEKFLTLCFPFHWYAMHCVKYQVNMVPKSLICCMC